MQPVAEGSADPIPEGRSAGPRGLGLAFIAAATLSAEVALTRLLSAGLFHHFAFVVVSTALFGAAAGGLAVVLRPGLSGRPTLPGWSSLAFALALPAAFGASQLVPLEPLALLEQPVQLVWLALVFLLLAAPFAASGLTIAAVLDADGKRASVLYAADLAGASVGCFLALAMLSFGPSGLYGASILAIGAGVALRAPARAVVGVAAGLGIAAAVAPLPLRISESKVTRAEEPFARLLADPQRTLKTAWGPLGRIDVVAFNPRVRRVVIDAGVAAVRVPLGRPRASDVTLPYELKPGARVLVIGAGAGWEVQEALHFGAISVDAVEINPLIAREAPPRLRTDPRVTWHVVDGRSFLHRPGPRYDAIVLLHTISNAATASGALRMAEDYLLTVEALQAMLDRLTDDGILLMTRPEAQLPPLVWNLRRAGAPPTALWSWAETPDRGGFYAAVMVRPSGWSPAQSARIRARLAQRRLPTLMAPDGAGVGPTAERLRQLGASSDTTPRVATDDRPYFHQHRRWSWPWPGLRGQQDRARLALEDRPLAEASVLLLLVETTVMAAIVLLVPLAGQRRRSGRLAVHFGSLGLGFMLLEVALVQRLGLLLGSPTLAFAVVFAGLLAGTAAGSALSRRWPWPRHAPAAAAGIALGLAAALPTLVATSLSWPDAARGALALAVVAASGLALGLPFPLGLRQIADAPGAERTGRVAWALAFNGIMSVAGTSLALLIGGQLGLTATLLAAAAAYLLAWGVPAD